MLINGREVLVGADPELFVRDKERNEFVCADGPIARNKKRSL